MGRCQDEVKIASLEHSQSPKAPGECPESRFVREKSFRGDTVFNETDFEDRPARMLERDQKETTFRNESNMYHYVNMACL